MGKPREISLEKVKEVQEEYSTYSEEFLDAVFDSNSRLQAHDWRHEVIEHEVYLFDPEYIR